MYSATQPQPASLTAQPGLPQQQMPYAMASQTTPFNPNFAASFQHQHPQPTSGFAPADSMYAVSFASVTVSNK